MPDWPPIRPLVSKGEFSIREFVVDHGETIIAIFQGSRGANPQLDMIVKYKQRGKRLRTPRHLHWAIDLLIKKQHNQSLADEFTEYLIRVYDDVQPFQSVEDRLERKLIGINGHALRYFDGLNSFGEYSVEFTSHILELIAIQEKTSNPNAFMFRKVLSDILENAEIFTIVSTAGFGR